MRANSEQGNYAADPPNMSCGAAYATLFSPERSNNRLLATKGIYGPAIDYYFERGPGCSLESTNLEARTILQRYATLSTLIQSKHRK